MKVDWRVHELFPSQWSKKTEFDNLTKGDVIWLYDGYYIEDVKGDEGPDKSINEELNEGMYVAMTGLIQLSSANVAPFFAINGRTKGIKYINQNNSEKQEGVKSLIYAGIPDDVWDHVARISTNNIEVLLPEQSEIILPKTTEDGSGFKLLIPKIDNKEVTNTDVVAELEPRLDEIDSALLDDINGISTVDGGVAEKL